MSADRTIPHRELRNNSSAILREVQSGSTIQITNHGEVVAIMTPPNLQPLAEARVRRATIRGGFSSLQPATVAETTQKILDDLRGEK